MQRCRYTAQHICSLNNHMPLSSLSVSLASGHLGQRAAKDDAVRVARLTAQQPDIVGENRVRSGARASRRSWIVDVTPSCFQFLLESVFFFFFPPSFIQSVFWRPFGSKTKYSSKLGQKSRPRHCRVMFQFHGPLTTA